MDAVMIETEAMKLPEAERAVVVDHLQESLSTSKITYLQEHLAESHSRYEAYKRGEIKAINGRDFIASLRAKLNS